MACTAKSKALRFLLWVQPVVADSKVLDISLHAAVRSLSGAYITLQSFVGFDLAATSPGHLAAVQHMQNIVAIG